MSTAHGDSVNATPAVGAMTTHRHDQVAGEALLAKAVEVLSVTPVRRVPTNEMMGLHGTRRSDEGRGRGVASKSGSRWRDRSSVGCSHLHRRRAAPWADGGIAGRILTRGSVSAVMRPLARAKPSVPLKVRSWALAAEAKQTSL